MAYRNINININKEIYIIIIKHTVVLKALHISRALYVMYTNYDLALEEMGLGVSFQVCLIKLHLRNILKVNLKPGFNRRKCGVEVTSAYIHI